MSMNGFNFTEEVRRAFVGAREEAARLHHEWVGTEHILLGLIDQRQSAGSGLLTALSVDLDGLRQMVDHRAKPGTDSGANAPDLPYTSRAKKVLEFAMTEARDLGAVAGGVGTDHLLLGLLREAKGIAAQVLGESGVTIEGVYGAMPNNPIAVAKATVGSSKPHPTPVDARQMSESLHREIFTAPVTSGPVGLNERIILLVLGALALVVSRIGAYEPGTWLLEVFPIMLGVPLLIATRKRFPLTPLVYRLIFLHALILMLGGHYTYARVPLGFWVQDALDLARNHYDRLGHFAQGFIPAMIAREILLRRSPVPRGKWLFFLVTCVCLSVSVFYEFIEWAAAHMGGSSAESFLGTQGDVWDTQWDMFMAFVGAVTAQLLLSRAHDRQLARLTTPEPQHR